MQGTVLTRTTEERRNLSRDTAQVSVRSAADGGAARFNGYAAVFGQRTAIGNPLTWGFYEECAQGMFAKTLGEGDARFLIDHDSFYVVSRSSANSLNLAEDDHGLAVDSALDTRLSYVNDLMVNVELKNITGMSFGFQTMRDEWTTEQIETSDGNTADVEIRTLIEVKLIEVSAVTFPAYATTTAELNSVASALSYRGDAHAIEQRAHYRPELLDLCKIIERAPAETTRTDEQDAEAQESAPAVSTRLTGASAVQRMRLYASKYRLPVK